MLLLSNTGGVFLGPGSGGGGGVTDLRLPSNLGGDGEIDSYEPLLLLIVLLLEAVGEIDSLLILILPCPGGGDMVGSIRLPR